MKFETQPVVSEFLRQPENGGVKCEVIKIEEHDGKRAVNARELHQKLGSKYQFANWIQERIEKYGFIENQDFEVFKIFLKNSNGGRSRKEYALSLDMAKELCMVENNDAGRRIRKYFIEVEKEFRERNSIPDFTDPAIAARAWADQYEKNKRLTLENERKQEALEKSAEEIVELSSQITQMQPKATYYDTILANKSTVKVSQIAQDYGMSAIAFNKLLQEHKLQRRVGKQWILFGKFLDKGYVHSESIPIEHHDGSLTYNFLTVWTQKGRIFLYDFLKGFGILPMIERGAKGETH